MSEDWKIDNTEDSAVEVKGIRRKKQLKKAPDAPKRFKSAYICYVMEKMEDAKKMVPPDTKITDTMKVLAVMWRDLPAHERSHYERIAENDKNRYVEEMATYDGPMQVPNKRQKKAEGAPKRAMSAFLSYSQQMRATIRAQYPDLKNTDISGILAKKWREASEEEKRPHLERECRDREKYHKEMAEWREEVEKKRTENDGEKTTEFYSDIMNWNGEDFVPNNVVNEQFNNGLRNENNTNLNNFKMFGSYNEAGRIQPHDVPFFVDAKATDNRVPPSRLHQLYERQRSQDISYENNPAPNRYGSGSLYPSMRNVPFYPPKDVNGNSHYDYLNTNYPYDQRQALYQLQLSDYFYQQQRSSAQPYENNIQHQRVSPFPSKIQDKIRENMDKNEAWPFNRCVSSNSFENWQSENPERLDSEARSTEEMLSSQSDNTSAQINSKTESEPAVVARENLGEKADVSKDDFKLSSSDSSSNENFDYVNWDPSIYSYYNDFSVSNSSNTNSMNSNSAPVSQMVSDKHGFYSNPYLSSSLRNNSMNIPIPWNHNAFIPMNPVNMSNARGVKRGLERSVENAEYMYPGGLSLSQAQNVPHSYRELPQQPAPSMMPYFSTRSF